MILITGGAGFIGANLIRKINKTGNKDIIIVDNLKKSKKNINLLKFKDFFDKNEFYKKICNGKIYSKIKTIIHLGACSDTTETNWEYLSYNNIIYTKKLYNFSKSLDAKFIYASSGAVYGEKSGHTNNISFSLKPLNLYGKSKLEIDKFFFYKSSKNVIGLRFFNVYGNLETHKKDMRSPVSKFTEQLKRDKFCNVFKFKTHEEPQRDFIHVNDATNILDFLYKKKVRGIYNVGTGKSKTFVQVAKTIIKNLDYGKINYIEFPKHLKNKYQFYTVANMNKLKKLGYSSRCMSLNNGIKNFLKNYS
tara:strand:+ start:646 stop:1560 length:915 start_codon:yes stop_codon:yes gene_type:complete